MLNIYDGVGGGGGYEASQISASTELLAIIFKFLAISFEKYYTMLDNYRQRGDTQNQHYVAPSEFEKEFLVKLKNLKLFEFLSTTDGIKFVQQVIISEGKGDRSNWILLQRLFFVLYNMCIQHKTHQSTHLSANLIESMVDCVMNGHR